MKGHFHSARKKVEWAYQKVNDLNAAIAGFFGQPNAYSFFCHIDPQTKCRILKAMLVEPIPDEWSRIVGEHLYQVRSALDVMAVTLARLNGWDDTSHVYFPFAGDKKEFEEKGTQRKIKKLRSDDALLISSLQPYRGGNDFLWAIGQFAIMDKHIDLIPMGSGGSWQSLGGGMTITGGMRIDGRPSLERSEEGITLVTASPIATFEFQPDANAQISSLITFGEVEWFKNKPVIPTILQITQFVDGVVKAFEGRYDIIHDGKSPP